VIDASESADPSESSDVSESSDTAESPDAAESSDAAPDRWLAISVDSVSPIVSELLVEPLLALGARGVQEADGRLITHVPPPADAETFVKRAQDLLRAATGLDDIDLTWWWQDHRDWSVLWRQGLASRAVTDRLVISPSWCEASAPEGGVVVVIDPGMAFGTAEHETTRGALRLMDRALSPGERLLDAGCGSGILAISAVRLGADHVLGVDIDPYACGAARENATVNGVADSVGIEEAAVTPEWLRGRGPFDGVLANIQAGVLTPLLESFAGVLRPGGWMILSGITEHEWLEMSQSTTASGFELEDVDAEGEWRTGWFTRRVDSH
jgi:ribosomal protein L11 methyltransferase